MAPHPGKDRRESAVDASSASQGGENPLARALGVFVACYVILAAVANATEHSGGMVSSIALALAQAGFGLLIYATAKGILGDASAADSTRGREGKRPRMAAGLLRTVAASAWLLAGAIAAGTAMLLAAGTAPGMPLNGASAALSAFLPCVPACICAPLFEEALFRLLLPAALLSMFTRREGDGRGLFGPQAFSALLASLVFAAMHLTSDTGIALAGGSPVLLLALKFASSALFGFSLVLIYRESRSFAGIVAVHALSNVIVSACCAFAPAAAGSTAALTIALALQALCYVPCAIGGYRRMKETAA